MGNEKAGREFIPRGFSFFEINSANNQQQISIQIIKHAAVTKSSRPLPCSALTLRDEGV